MPFSSRALVGFSLLLCACAHPLILPPGDPRLKIPEEKHFGDIRQLTHEGTNAEAYWSFDGRWLSLQRKVPGVEDCDQIYRIRSDGTELTRVSSGEGRTTCSFYFPDGARVLYSSTAGAGPACPTAPDHSHGYVWPIYDAFQMYSSFPDGARITPMEPGAPRAYNAEGTVCRDGSVVFTSDRDGDLELYTAKLDTALGTLHDVKRVTNTPGYDGGAFFSADCTKLVWRAARPRQGKELNDYRELLKSHLVRPGELEIWTSNADGTQARQVTQLGAASFAPFFTPDAKRIIFASNPRDEQGRKFDLYLINVNGTGLERVTYSDTFESFPMFSPDGHYLAFSSNRGAAKPHETNLFIADWIETPAAPPALDDARPADRYLALVAQLASPEFEGRGPGTEGLKKAESLVEKLFGEIGLKPVRSKSFRQAVDIEQFHQNNLLGSLGSCGGNARPVVVGAHLDHLGFGAENSLEPTKKGLHAGADDNASGIAAVVETARILGQDRALLKKSCFYFAAFTGEEIGILGSSAMVKWMKKEGIRPKAMLNFDMVGRLRDNKLLVFGTDSAKEWRALVDSACDENHLSCPGGGDGYGPSDHMAFYVGGSPVLHFFTGPHADYHRPSDTADKINATGGVQVAQLVAEIARRAGSPRQHFTFQRAAAAPQMGHLTSSSGQHSNGAYLGTIPDYGGLSSPHGPSGGAAKGGGVPLAGVRAGSPAEKAGVREGDILLSIDGRELKNLQAFTDVLMDLKPEQKVILVVRRGEAMVKLEAVIGSRARP